MEETKTKIIKLKVTSATQENQQNSMKFSQISQKDGRYAGTLKGFEAYHQANLQSQFLTNFANICSYALNQNDSLNAQIVHKYLEFRNPNYKNLITDYLLLGTIPNVAKFYLSNLMPTTTDEKEKNELNELKSKLESIMATAKNTTPILFFYTNPSGLVEQIKVRYIYKIAKTVNTSDEKIFWSSELSNISFLDERENKQFAIVKAKKQTINAFALHLFTDRPKFTVFITEGEFNTISLLAKEYKNRGDSAFNDVRVVSLGSAQNLEQNINLFKYLLKTNDNIVFALDNDDAGNKAIYDFVTKHKEFQNCFMLSLPKSKSKIEKDIDDYVSANDFVAASEIYKDIKIKPIKEQMFLLEKSLSNKEQERIKALLQSAEKFGFEFVKTLYKQSINYDDEEIDFEKFDKIIEREWLIENLIPKGKITVFAGLGGSGKTTIALQWMLNMLLGINVANGIETKQIERAMIISAEEDKEEIVGKINSLLYKYFTIVTGKKYETLQTELDYRIKIITKHKILTTTIFEKVTTTEDYVVVNNYIEDFNPDLIIIDSLTSTNMVEIQKSSIAQSVMLLIEKLVRNRSCILLHHLAKDAINSKDIKDISIDQVLGSASLANKVRQVLLLHKNKLKVGKSNLLSFDAIANTYYSLEEIVDSKGVTINWGWKIRKIRVLRQHQQKQKMTRKEIIKQKQKQIQIQKQIKEDKNED